eukprot:scaffold2053_cov144-Skeletonema_menzelii.AAC.7
MMHLTLRVSKRYQDHERAVSESSLERASFGVLCCTKKKGSKIGATRHSNNASHKAPLTMRSGNAAGLKGTNAHITSHNIYSPHHC